MIDDKTCLESLDVMQDPGTLKKKNEQNDIVEIKQNSHVWILNNKSDNKIILHVCSLFQNKFHSTSQSWKIKDWADDIDQ